MKEDLFKLIREGNLASAFQNGEEFLKKINDHYYSWTMLQSKFNDKKNENTKGILSTEEFTRHTNLINTQLLDLILKIDSDIQFNNSTPVDEETFVSKLKNSLMGSYNIEEVLSEGALAVNYKAKEVFDHTTVVIKAIKNEGYVNVTDFFEDVNKARQFNHRNIISVLGKSTLNASPKYVVMEYIGGTPLQLIVNEHGARPKGETKRLLLKLSEALFYLHKRKVFNADLKAERIFLDKEGEPMISPFNLYTTSSDSNYDQMVTNFRFMSLDRLNARGYVKDNPRANQFGLGVLAYFLMVGEHLFQEESIIDLIEARRLFDKDEAYRFSKLNKLDSGEELNNLVKKLLSTNVADGFQSMPETIAYLQSIGDNTSLHDKVAQESYSRACSFNPQITMQLVEQINNNSEDESSVLDNKEAAIKLHNTINLFIETDYGKSYLMKATQSKELSPFFFRHKDLFRDTLLELLADADYLWSETIKNSWEKTLMETFEEVSLMYSEPEPETGTSSPNVVPEEPEQRAETDRGVNDAASEDLPG